MHVQYAVKLRITSHSQLTLSANTRRTIPVLQRQTNSFKYTHNKKQIREPCIIYINDIQLQFVSDFLQSCFMPIAICFTRYHHEFTSTWPQCLNTWALAEKKIYIFINKPFRPLKSSDIKNADIYFSAAMVRLIIAELNICHGGNHDASCGSKVNHAMCDSLFLKKLYMMSDV